MRARVFLAAAGLLLSASLSPAGAAGLSAVLRTQPEPRGLPALFTMSDGTPVRTVEDWETKRRPEILKMYEEMVYGIRPVGRPEGLRFETNGADRVVFGGEGFRRDAIVRFTAPRGEGRIRAFAYLPAKTKGPFPTFLLICNSPFMVEPDAEKGMETGYWPVREILRRGFATVAFAAEDVAPDEAHDFARGVHALYGDPAGRTETSWGCLSAWAWGASRVMDWIESVSDFDRRHVALVGNSRGGKTALWAGATDTRFFLTCVNDSGCGGARLNHVVLPLAETIGFLSLARPHWMCGAWRRWCGLELETPFDQHLLMAAVAPRHLAVASATQDFGAGPWGEYLSVREASPAWELYGGKGLLPRAFPEPGAACRDGDVSYHLRVGAHALTAEDWTRYMDFFASFLGPEEVPRALFGDEALRRLQASVPGTNLTAFGAHDASFATLAKGVDYSFVRFSSLYGRPVDAHFIRIPDPASSVRMKISANALRPVGSKLRRTSVAASEEKALFAINGNMFRWSDVPNYKPYYYTKADGRAVPSCSAGGSGLAFNPDGTFAMGAWNAASAERWQNVFTCECLVKGGRSQVDTPGARASKNAAGYPLIGRTKEGVLWFVVFDGRRKGVSEGLTYYTSSLLLQALGCEYGTLYDGGGSTTLAVRTSALPAQRLAATQRASADAPGVTIMNFVNTNGRDWSERAVVDQLLVFEAP